MTIEDKITALMKTTESSVSDENVKRRENCPYSKHGFEHYEEDLTVNHEWDAEQEGVRILGREAYWRERGKEGIISIVVKFVDPFSGNNVRGYGCYLIGEKTTRYVLSELGYEKKMDSVLLEPDIRRTRFAEMSFDNAIEIRSELTIRELLEETDFKKDFWKTE